MLKKKFKNYNPKLKEECGVFGISNVNDASAVTALGLHALQHRGQEGCGIVTFDGEKYHSEKRFGLVGDNFNKEKVLKKLPGKYAVGHNRYSTTGGTTLRNIQPFFADTNAGGISVSHNGNLTNAITLRSKLVQEGSIFYTTSDTETIVQLIAKSKRSNTEDKIIDWQGTEQIKKYNLGFKLITFFILPPSKDELFNRLRNRDMKDKNIVHKRMKQFNEDINHWKNYDFVVINDNLETCYNEIVKFIDVKTNNLEHTYNKKKN